MRKPVIAYAIKKERKKGTNQPLASFFGCPGWFVSDRVENSTNWCSRYDANIA